MLDWKWIVKDFVMNCDGITQIKSDYIFSYQAHDWGVYISQINEHSLLDPADICIGVGGVHR